MAMTAFEDLAPLGEADLRRLLGEGDDRERAWAAWRLLQHLAAPDRDLTVPRPAPEPSARRHLLATAAGRGEDELLIALTRHDPDPGVRAAAVALAGRRALIERVPWDDLRAALGDQHPDVRIAALDTLPATLEPEVVERLDDPDERVRWAAFDWLSARGRLQAIAGRLDRCRADEREARLERLLAGYPPAAVARALAGTSRETRLAALGLVREAERPQIAALLALAA